MRIFRWLALLALGMASAAGAQHRGIDDYLITAVEFETYAASTPNGPQQLGDRQARRMLRRLANARATFGDERFTLADLDLLGTLLQRSIAVASVYMQHNIDPTDASPQTPAAQAANIVAYQNEVIPLLAFALDAGAVIARTQAQIFEGGEAPDAQTRDRLVQMRGGIEQMLGGVITLSGGPGISFDNRLVAMRAISRNAPTLAATLSVAQREQALEALNALGESDNDAVSREQARAMEGLRLESCTGFCPL